jgi:ketosteroid isomerase-like protein
MSQDNVEIVLRLYPARDVNIAGFWSDDGAWAAFVGDFGHCFHPDFETSTSTSIYGWTEPYIGLDGLRTFWLDWLSPWVMYRTEVEEAIDCGDRVLVLINNFGRLAGSAEEVKLVTATIWTIRDGRIARIEGYADPAEALKAVGLAA